MVYNWTVKKEGSLAIGDQIGESGRHYAKWGQPDRKTNAVWPHLHVESKKQANKQLHIYREYNSSCLGLQWGNECLKIKILNYKNKFRRSYVELCDYS